LHLLIVADRSVNLAELAEGSNQARFAHTCRVYGSRFKETSMCEGRDPETTNGPAPRVSSEHQTRIFDQFYQVDSSNTKPTGGTRSRACDQPRSRAPTMPAPIHSEGLLTEDEFSTSQHSAVAIMINAR
jgi:hypothetical protein